MKFPNLLATTLDIDVRTISPTTRTELSSPVLATVIWRNNATLLIGFDDEITSTRNVAVVGGCGDMA